MNANSGNVNTGDLNSGNTNTGARNSDREPRNVRKDDLDAKTEADEPGDDAQERGIFTAREAGSGMATGRSSSLLPASSEELVDDGNVQGGGELVFERIGPRGPDRMEVENEDEVVNRGPDRMEVENEDEVFDPGDEHEQLQVELFFDT
jgi:hypothetical protein